jgi:TolB protein
MLNPYNTFLFRKNRLFFIASLLILTVTFPSCKSEDGEDGTGSEDREDNAYQVDINLSGSLQNPAWSPDGKSLLFTRFRNGYNTEPADLYIVNLETGEVRVLVSDGSGNVNLPGSSWNEDTGKIVFSSSRDPHDEIYIIDAGGIPGDEEKITQRNDYQAYEPSFSPDGLWIVFESHPIDVEGEGKIIKTETNKTGSYIELTTTGDCRQPNWSPEDDLILYQQLAGDKWDIWVMDTDGSNPEQITTGEGDNTDASFSDDGLKIVYSADNGELEFANLFTISVSGGSPERLTFHNGGYDGAPSWSPGGTKVAFESCAGEPDDSDGATIWIIELE